MPVVNLTLTNIFYLVSFISPLLIVFYLIFSSLLSGFPMKGVLYFTGCILLTLLVVLTRNIIKNQQSDRASIICNTLPFPFGQSDGIAYNAPYMNIVLLVFTFFYILLSMMYNKYAFNILLIIFLGLIVICNIGVEFINSCVDITSIVISILFGAFFALLWYSTVATINPAYTYFSEFVNNNVVCSKPRAQSYVCSQKSGLRIEEKLSQDQVDQVINSMKTIAPKQVKYKVIINLTVEKIPAASDQTALTIQEKILAKINEYNKVGDTNQVVAPTIKLTNQPSLTDPFTYEIKIIDDFVKSYEIYEYFLKHFDDPGMANKYLTSSAPFCDVTKTSITHNKYQ